MPNEHLAALVVSFGQFLPGDYEQCVHIPSLGRSEKDMVQNDHCYKGTEVIISCSHSREFTLW